MLILNLIILFGPAVLMIIVAAKARSRHLKKLAKTKPDLRIVD